MGGILRILGIDPGYATVGYGIVDTNGFKFSVVGYGAITTPADLPFPERLGLIYEDMLTIIEKYNPQELSLERLYFNTNTTTDIDVAQARGVILFYAHSKGLKINEYTPLQVKQSVTGYGKAEKRQVMEMVKTLLKLKSIPKPDDTADALALAICHGYFAGSGISKILREEQTK